MPTIGPVFGFKENPVANGFYIIRDMQEVTFVSAEEFFEIKRSGVLPSDPNDIYELIIALLRNMKVIKLHPSQYTIERISA